MKFVEYGVIILCILLVALVFVGFITCMIENEALREENHMLKNTLADLGADIEELSTTVDRLMEDINRSDEWNKNIEGF